MDRGGDEGSRERGFDTRSSHGATAATNQRKTDDSRTADSATEDMLDVVSRRAPLLAALAAGERTKAELADAVSVSRSTVDRGLRELEAIEAVTRTDDGYRLGLPGRLLYRLHERYRRRLDGTRRAARLLAALPADFDLDPRVVDGAAVVTAGGTSLHQPIHRQRELLATADHVRGFWSAVPQYVETYYRQAAAHELQIALVVQPTVTQQLLLGCSAALQQGLSTGRLRLRERDHDAGPPCNLVVCDSEAGATLGLTVHDDNGVVGFLENDDPEAVAWAEAFFERYWETATPLDPGKTTRTE